MMRLPNRMRRDQRGVAAAEMALMLPLLTVILFGGIEGGHFFLTEHEVLKSVRTAARYAARQDFENFECDATDLGDVDADVRNVARTGTVSGTDPIVRNWAADDADSISILVICDTGSDYSESGIYADMSGTGTPAVDSAMTVRIAVEVGYPSLFADIGLLDGTNLAASAESAVTGF